MNATLELSSEEKKAVWDAVYRNWERDDRNPKDVIKDRHDGDTDAYLLAMAKWHGIPVEALNDKH